MKTINRTNIAFKQKTTRHCINTLSAEISTIRQNSFDEPVTKLNQLLALEEIETMLKNIATLGTHDPQIIRKADGQTFQQSLFS